MRYYIDTNILAFLITERKEELSSSVRKELFDYSNSLITSATCVHELIHLCQTGKLTSSHKKSSPNPVSVIEWIHEMDIRIAPASEIHLQQYSELPFHGDHRDPNDRLIIAQAIADRIPIISSDRKFNEYIQDGLSFVFNER